MNTAIHAKAATAVQSNVVAFVLPSGFVYEAPDRPGTEWTGYEAGSFTPNDRQQIVINAVTEAVDGGLFYTDEVVEKVAVLLRVSQEVRAKNTGNVEHGNFGSDVYYARRTLEAQRKAAQRVAVAAQMRLAVGEKLGTVMFSDCKRVNATVVEAMSENGMSITVIGKRGASCVRSTLCPLQLMSVIDRAREHGARKGGYAEFVEERSAGGKGVGKKEPSRPVKAPLTKQQFDQLRADALDLRGTAARKGTTLDRWDEAREGAAARDYFDLGAWLFYYSTRVGRVDGLKDRIDCLRRLFEAGVHQPGYQFFTVFDFGERDFDTCVEMGDAHLVLDGLRELAHKHRNPNLLAAFEYMGWSLESNQQALF